MYHDEEEEAPTVQLGEQPQGNNPFSKQCEKSVDKFKALDPKDANKKQNCGNGRVSI